MLYIFMCTTTNSDEKQKSFKHNTFNGRSIWACDFGLELIL